MCIMRGEIDIGWFQERYLSEYHYDEAIDEDKERRLLNFGDDYRNFLDSLSESHSSLGGHLLDDRRKRSKRLSKKKLVSGVTDTVVLRRTSNWIQLFLQPDCARLYDTC